ncbi:hypothetical protein QTP86_027409, partial [Hemibagrus guttatus]
SSVSVTVRKLIIMKELRTGTLWRAVTAELVGMTLFVFIGIASAIGTSEYEGPDQEVKVALAFGLAIATLAQSLGHVSGAHLNPAITVGLLVSCQISALRAVLYILAQMLGAVLASGIVYGIRPKDVKALGLNEIAENMTQGKAFGVEFLATFQLVLCVLAATDSRRNDVKGSAPLAIGLSVGLGHLVAISYTGCGINPARSFGPAVIMKSFKKHWHLQHSPPPTLSISNILHLQHSPPPTSSTSSILHLQHSPPPTSSTSNILHLQHSPPLTFST